MKRDQTDSLQNIFLAHIMKNKIPLTVFLMNGVRLQGTVTGFDNLAVLLSRDASTQVIYKKTISTIAPIEPIQLSTAPGDMEVSAD